MDKKKKTYLLLLFVAGLWGTIGYQVLSALEPNSLEQKQEDVSISYIPKYKEIDTFSISQLKRDPFLGKLSSNTIKRRKLTSSKVTTKIDDILPTISYLGLIKKKRGGQKTFIISINNTQYLFKINQEFEKVKLLKGSEKSVTILFNKKRKIIKAQ